MNITFLISTLESSGGTQRILCHLCNLLCEKYKITILVNYGQNSFFYLDERINTINIAFKSKNFLYKNWQIYKILKKTNSKYYINLDSNSIILNGFILPKHTKLILWEHFSLKDNYKKLLFKLSRHYAVLRSKKIVLLSKNEINAWKKYNTKSIKKIKLIYNPLPFDYSIIEQSNKYHLKRFLAIGNDIQVKGFDILIKAWKKNKKDWKLRIVGLSEQKIEELRKYCSIHKVENIELYGKCDDISIHYKQSSVFVLPSRKEATPLVLIESQSFGLPAIIFDHLTSALELINESAITVKFNENSESLEKAINTIIDNEKLYNYFYKQTLINSKKFKSEIFLQNWTDLLK